MYLRPHFASRFDNLPIIDQSENLSTFSCKKSELKGVPLYDKNCQLMYFGPYNVDRFEQMGVSANFDFINIFLFQIKIQRGCIS